ncbi:MAG: dihydrolipoamide acetyltransferase family protein [Kiritimatiellae bacterium]|nr:dihydrolipoamide acetyltransferase family protein [Kiritimatiellia bacterium]MDD5520969.1 dihydrolipoamide acetyltransferase family protein [Kiritimatiellia bacterium]
MAQVLILPKLGQTMEEGAIVKWHKKEGDPVKKGDIVFEIETDKAALEVESFFEGTLLKILLNEGITVPVNTPVGYVGQPGEKLPDAPPTVAPVAKPEVPKAAAASTPARDVQRPAVEMPAVGRTPKPAAVELPKAGPSRLFISPRARALVKKCVIDATGIRGSGPDGRIIEKDVQNYLDSHGYSQLRISPAAKKLAAKEGIDILKVKATGDGGRIMVHDVERAVAEKPKAMSKMRQVIARRLTESFSSIPHFYVSVSVDMTDLMLFRQDLKNSGKKFTVTDFILEAVTLSLVEFPVVNSYTDGTSVSLRSSVQLGMAVSVTDGLVVPVIRNAEILSMQELHDISQVLAGKAREGKLLPDDMTGSTFTVSNMGMLDVDNFNAIINPGEAAILAVASTKPTPAVHAGQIKIRQIMKITLSVDHRIVDGAVGAAFANSVKKKLEDIELWKSLT